MKLFVTLTLLLAIYGVNARKRFEESIVNGSPAEEAEAPYQIFLRQEISPTQWMICGGTLIKPNKVLTAAHCTTPKKGDVFVRYGTNDREKQVYPDIKVSKIAIHPKYDEGNLVNDIAVLTLEKNVKEDQRVRFIPLRKADLNKDDKVTIYGWGRLNGDDITSPKMLQKTTLKVTRTDDTKIYAQSSVNSIACQGDSGGVMVSADNKQCGVLSAVQKGCPPGGLNVYTKVSAFIDWINSQ